MTSTQWAYLGPLGRLRSVPNPAPAVTTARTRARSELTTLGGLVYAQRAPRSRAAWEIAHTWCAPDSLAHLTACADGALPGPLYLYTGDAARTNLLPADVAAPCQAGTTSLGSVAGTVAVGMPSGVEVLTGVVQQAAVGAWSRTIPLRPGVGYVLSAWGSAAGALIEWRSVSAAGVPVASGTLSAVAEGTGFYGAVALVPDPGVGLQVRLAAGSRTVGGLRLVEGTRVQDGPMIATNLATNPSFEATSGTVEVRRNRSLTPMPYRDAVAGAAWFPEWGTGGSGASAYSASSGPDGVPYFGMTWGVAGTGPTRLRLTGQNTQGIPVTVGEAVPVSVDVASNHPGGVRIAWDWYNDTTYVASGAGAFVVPSADIASPTRVSATTNAAPAGANRLILYVYCSLPAVGTYIRATRLLVGDEGAFFAPGLPSPDSDVTPSWTGTANASASVLTGVGVRGLVAGINRAPVSSAQWAAAGSRSLRVIRTAAGDSYVGVPFTLEAGRTYTLVITSRTPAPLATLGNVTVQENGGSNRGTATVIPSGTIMSGEQQWRATFTLPPDWHTSTRVNLRTGATVGDSIWWDNLAVIEGEYTGPWFDGSHAPAGTYATWDGAPDASPSTLRRVPDDVVTPGWAPGRGVPQVVVDDPTETLQLVTDREILADYTVTIREVG